MIVLVCGASGTGKTAAAYQLAVRLGLALVELDDIVEALKAMTAPQQLPALHRWDTDPATRGISPDEIVALQMDVAAELLPAVDAVIDNHLDTGTPVVLEGDQLLPLARPGVHAIVLHEPAEEQLIANYRSREPAAGDQIERAAVSRLHGDLLIERAAATGVPVVAARPWADVVERVLAALALDA